MNEEIERECAKRMEAGALKYGLFDPKTCTRDMMNEIREEVLDIINYCRMHRAKFNDYDYTIENIAFELYKLTYINK